METRPVRIDEKTLREKGDEESVEPLQQLMKVCAWREGRRKKKRKNGKEAAYDENQFGDEQITSKPIGFCNPRGMRLALVSPLSPLSCRLSRSLRPSNLLLAGSALVFIGRNVFSRPHVTRLARVNKLRWREGVFAENKGRVTRIVFSGAKKRVTNLHRPLASLSLSALFFPVLSSRLFSLSSCFLLSSVPVLLAPILFARAHLNSKWTSFHSNSHTRIRQ